MDDQRARSSKKAAIAIGVAGIFIEFVAIVLLASKRISVGAGMPLVILGMLFAFVPIFVAARRGRERR